MTERGTNSRRREERNIGETTFRSAIVTTFHVPSVRAHSFTIINTKNSSVFYSQITTTTAMSKQLLLMCMEYMNHTDLMTLNRVDNELKAMTSGENRWVLFATIQERKVQQGRHMFLFQQYLMSREQAKSLPPSNKYK